MKTDTFWNAVKKFKKDKPTKCGLTPATEAQIEHYTNRVLNPLSHHDINKHEITSKILGALTTIKALKAKLNV